MNDNSTYATSSATYDTEPQQRYQTAQWSTSTWYGKRTEYQTWVVEKKQETVRTHSFDADANIAIDFIGNNEGSINVTVEQWRSNSRSGLD